MQEKIKALLKNLRLNESLNAEQGRNNLFATQIQTITGSVNTLQKLSQTDKELLQKYYQALTCPTWQTELLLIS